MVITVMAEEEMEEDGTKEEDDGVVDVLIMAEEMVVDGVVDEWVIKGEEMAGDGVDAWEMEEDGEREEEEEEVEVILEDVVSTMTGADAKVTRKYFGLQLIASFERCDFMFGKIFLKYWLSNFYSSFNLRPLQNYLLSFK